MTFSGSKTVRRLALLLAAGALAPCISLASSLPGTADKAMDSAQSALLPSMMDAAASFTDTGNSSPAIVPPSPLQTRSGGLTGIADAADAQDRPDNMGNGCVPEPVSIFLMASGMLGLVSVRRFSRTSRQLVPVSAPAARSSSLPETYGSYSR
jgi:hypothetical protein